MKSLIIFLLQVVSLVAAQGPKCNRDNCLRAIVASSKPTRSGVEDCNSYLKVTVTPSTSTIYSTLSLTTSITQVVSVTDTTILELTEYTTQEATATAGVTETVTAPFQMQDKRQATDVPSIPTYATACSGSVRYSSACFCAGATGTTITAPTPTTTILVSEISTITATSLITASTETLLVTAATETATTVVATQTNTIATVTTTASPPPQPTFHINMVTGPEKYLNNYRYLGFGVVYEPGTVTFFYPISRDRDYTRFTIDPLTGQLMFPSRGLGVYYQLDPSTTKPQALITRTVAQAAADPLLKKYRVAIGSGGELLTDQRDSGYDGLTICGSGVTHGVYADAGTIGADCLVGWQNGTVTFVVEVIS